jgi:hypothetical protein
MLRADYRKILMDQRGAAIILWSCFTISIAIYIVIAHNVLANPKFSRGLPAADTVRIVLWILVAVDLGYYAYWKKRYLKPQTIRADRKNTKVLRALQEHKGRIEERAASMVSTYITRKIVIFAIIEALAVYGLVLALTGGFLADQYLLSALSLILLILEFPRESVLESLVRDAEGSQIEKGRSTA